MERGHGGWTVGRKRKRVEATQGGGREAGEEGGSEADRTKEKRKEGEIEARRRKEERVGPSNQARHSSSSLTSKRHKSRRKDEGHLYDHKMYEGISYLRSGRYSGSAWTVVRVRSRGRRGGTAQHHRGGA